MAIAGRVAIVPKGAYSETATYKKLDLVTYNEAAYIAKRESTGIEPTDGDDWMLLVSTDLTEIRNEINNIADGSTVVGKANALTTPRKINGVEFDGTEDITVTDKKEWQCTVKCATWSRLCLISTPIQIMGTTFLLNIQGTRNLVVYNETYLITTHHNQQGKLVKLNGNCYGSSVKVRLLSNSGGNCMVELYDDVHNTTSDTTQTVYCNLLGINIGNCTLYTDFTDGTTLPSGYIEVDIKASDTSYPVQTDVKGNFKGILDGTFKNPVNIGKASFNGGSDITLADIMGRSQTSNSGSSYVGKYTKIATIDVSSSAYDNCNGIIHCIDSGTHIFNGLLYFYVGVTSDISTSSIRLRWMHLSSVNYENTIVAVKVSDGVFDLYFKALITQFTLLSTLIDCDSPNKITMLSRQGYVDSVEPIATSSLGGYVAQALKDGNGNVIPDTYLRQDKVANNLVTNDSSYALGAPQGVALNEKIEELKKVTLLGKASISSSDSFHVSLNDSLKNYKMIYITVIHHQVAPFSTGRIIVPVDLFISQPYGSATPYPWFSQIMQSSGTDLKDVTSLTYMYTEYYNETSIIFCYGKGSGTVYVYGIK